MDIGSIFKSFEDAFDFLMPGRYPQPPKHLPLRILGLSGDPWPDTIKEAYRKKLFEAHPDLKPAFENPEYQEMAQKARQDLPDIQALVWARDCALKSAPYPKPVTTNKGNITVPLPSVTRTPQREYFSAEEGEPRVCRFCGKILEPKQATSRWQREPVVFCDECIEKENKKRYPSKYYISRYTKCPVCNVWFSESNPRIYCSRQCSIKAETIRQRKDRLRRRTDRVCPVCEKHFTPKRADGKYCSSACRQNAHRQRAGKKTEAEAVRV